MSDAQWQDLEGKPFTLQQKGRRYQEIAEAIQRSMSTLEAIENEVDNKSLAMDATRQLAADVRADIEKAKTRYAETGEALETYGKALEVAAYEQADPAAWQLRTLHGELAEAEVAERRAANAMEDLPDDATDAERTEASTAATTAGSTAGSLRTEVAKYEKQWTEGYEGKQSAAGIAKSKIHDAVYEGKAGDLNDSTWDKVKDWAAQAYKVLKAICDIAGILAIFLSWVPGLGQVLLALAALGAILEIVSGIVDMMKNGFSWGALAGIGLGVLGLFGGKAISSLAKYAKARTVVQTASRSTRTAKRAFGTTVLKQSRREFASMSRTSMRSHAWDTLKSPFKSVLKPARSGDDMAIWNMVKNGDVGSAMQKWQGTKFPMPYKDGASRFVSGNEDVVGMWKALGAEGAHVDDLSKLTARTASIGAVGLRGAGAASSFVNLSDSVSSGDVGGVVSGVAGVATQPAGGSYGDVSGNAISTAQGPGESSWAVVGGAVSDGYQHFFGR